MPSASLSVTVTPVESNLIDQDAYALLFIDGRVVKPASLSALSKSLPAVGAVIVPDVHVRVASTIAFAGSAE